MSNQVLEREYSNQFNAKITYVSNATTYVIPVSYIKNIELMAVKPRLAGGFEQNTAADYLVVTLHGIKGTSTTTDSHRVMSTIEHIDKLLGATSINIEWFPYITTRKPDLYRTKISMPSCTFAKFLFSTLDFSSSNETSCALYFSYTFGTITINT